MTKTIQNRLLEFGSDTLNMYRERLKGVYLFFPCTDDSQNSGVDADVMMVLDESGIYWEELIRTGELTRSLSLEYDLTVSRVFGQELVWLEGETPLMRNVHQEAIPA
jgi:hypothetical protein